MQDVVIALIVCGSIVLCFMLVTKGVMSLASGGPQRKPPPLPPSQPKPYMCPLESQGISPFWTSPLRRRGSRYGWGFAPVSLWKACGTP